MLEYLTFKIAKQFFHVYLLVKCLLRNDLFITGTLSPEGISWKNSSLIGIANNVCLAFYVSALLLSTKVLNTDSLDGKNK